MPLPEPINPDQLKELQEKLRRASEEFERIRGRLGVAESELREKDRRIAEFHVRLTSAEAHLVAREEQLRQRDAQLQEFQTKASELANKNLELQREIERIRGERPRVHVDKLIEQFRTQLTAINKAATVTAEEGPSVLVNQMEVEIKGGLDLHEGIQVTQLLAQELSPQSVSTIRFSLKPATAIKVIEQAQS